MRFIHTSDLHIGKTVNGFSMLEEQRHVLEQMVRIAKDKHADAFFISGDLYDRSIPPAEAVAVLDQFLTELVEFGIKVFAIAGNHDSGERLSFGSRILEKKGLHLAGGVQEEITYGDVTGPEGTVRIHLLPFAKPEQVKFRYGKELTCYQESVEEQLLHAQMLEGGANVLLTHHFVVNQGREPEVSDSETRIVVGGADQVDVMLFERFDYTALGHIHGSQQIGNLPVYYSGSPVKYSFSESHHRKAVLVGDVLPGKPVCIESVSLTPIHDMRRIKGQLAELIREDVYSRNDPEDYIMAVLTDDHELLDPMGTLRSVYPNIMLMELERRTRAEAGGSSGQSIRLRKGKDPLELFRDFYVNVTGTELDEDHCRVLLEAAALAEEEA